MRHRRSPPSGHRCSWRTPRLAAGVDGVAGVAEQVGAAIFRERRGSGKLTLRGQFLADVVAGEPVAPGEQNGGHGKGGERHDADPDQHGVDGAAPHRHHRHRCGLSSGVELQGLGCSHGLSGRVFGATEVQSNAHERVDAL